MDILLMMMGGSGTRLGADVPKQYIEINGKPIFYYIVNKYASMKEISLICIVSHKDWIEYVGDEIKGIAFQCPVVVAEGGNSRSESVKNGLAAVADRAGEKDVVLIHDATHPYVDKEGTLAVIEAVHAFGGATLGACQYDTCYQMDADKTIEKVIPRQNLVAGASPEAFYYGDISKIYFDSTPEELDKMTSAGAIALAHDIPMKVIPANVLNLKITYPEDLKLFQLLIQTYFFNEEENA